MLLWRPTPGETEQKHSMTLSQLVFFLNGLWFTAAFVQFSLAQTNTAKILVPRHLRDNPLVPTVKASVAFLGGMNLSLAALALFLAAGPQLFQEPAEQAALFAFLAAANFSQFYFNIPILMRGLRTGDAVWPVLKGPMLRIFVIDGALTIIDSAMAMMVGLQG